MDSIVSRACLQICRIVTFRSTKTPFWHTSLFTTRRWLHSGQHPIHSSSTNMYSPAQSRPRIEYITKIPNVYYVSQMYCAPICIHRHRADPELNTLQKNFMCTMYHKMYLAPICIPQPRAELNSQMQKRLSCSYWLVSRSLNFQVSLWRLHTFCPIFCWCHISKETGPCQTGRALLVVICCKLSSASVYRLKLKLELWSRSKAQSTMACRHPCYQALAIKSYSNLPYCLFAFKPRFLFVHFFLLCLQLSLAQWVQIRKDMFENSYKLPNGPYLMQTSSYMYGMILDKGPCLTWKSSS